MILRNFILIYGSPPAMPAASWRAGCRSGFPNYDTSPFGMPSLASPVYKYKGIKQELRILIIFLLVLSFELYALALSLSNGLSLGAREVLAQSLSLSISPPILEVMIKPGKSITQSYKIVNSGEPAIVTARIAEFTENGIKEDKDFTLESWVNVVSPHFSFNQPFLMPSGAEKQIVLRINPPAGTIEQDFYRVLLFTTTPNPPSEFSQSSASISIGSILLIKVSATGMTALGAQIAKFSLPHIIDSFGPLSTDIEVKNTGKTYFRPVGTINLAGPIGKGKYTIAPDVIFAGQTKKITAEIASKEDKTLFLSGFFLGKYRLGVGFTLDEGNIKIEQTKTFYAVPWKAGISILLLLFFISISIMYRGIYNV